MFGARVSMSSSRVCFATGFREDSRDSGPCHVAMITIFSELKMEFVMWKVYMYL